MSAFDEGYIKTSKGKIIDFTKSIIIATTNAGHCNKSEPIGFTTAESNAAEASISDLSASFDVELLNRFTKVFNFHPITEELYKSILADLYARDVATIKHNHSSYRFLADTLSDDVLNELVKESYAKEFGARPDKKTIQKYIEDAVLNHNKAKTQITSGATDSDDIANNTDSDATVAVEDTDISSDDTQK